MSIFLKALANDKLMVDFLCITIIIFAIIIANMIRILLIKAKSYQAETEIIEDEVKNDNEDIKARNDNEDIKANNNMFIDNRSISVTINNFGEKSEGKDIFNSEDLEEDDINETEEDGFENDSPKLIIGRIFSFCKKSFMARLIQSRPLSQEFYSELKNYILSFKDVKTRISWNYDSFNWKKNKMVKLNIKGKTLVMYIVLNPHNFANTKYHFKNVKDIKKYKSVPMMVYIRSHRAAKYAKELIKYLMDKNNIIQEEIPQIDYRLPYQSKEILIKRGLIKPPKKIKNYFKSKEKFDKSKKII